MYRSNFSLKEARVYCMGDMIEGEDIFAGQQWLIDNSLVDQIQECIDMLANALRRLLASFERVHFVGVIGNHGHIGGKNHRNYHPNTNFDRMVYKMTEMLFTDEPRIGFTIPSGQYDDNYYAVDHIGSYGTLLIHGDQLPNPNSLHMYFKKISGWKAGAIPESFDDVAMGHYHQNMKFTVGTSVVRINGTTESDNIFAQKVLGTMGRSSQHVQFVRPSVGVAFESDIFLD
jgi:hypothetical protein